MSILAQIKGDQLAARKAKLADTTSILTTLIGEAEMVGKNAGRETSDDEVRATVKKFIKNNDELVKATASSTASDVIAKANVATKENEILRKYLPAQLTDAQLTDVIQKLIDAAVKPTNVGVIMKGLKAALDGKYDYDGGMASKIAKSILV